MRVIGYVDALAESAENRRHLLLGNGFSIAAHPDFRYNSLFEEAFGAGDERLRQIFDALETTDFEQVLSSLDNAQTVLTPYPDGQAVAAQIQADRNLIARRLIEVITRIHPGSARDLHDRRYESVARFLQEMRRPNDQNLAGRIYTTNYDLLLYWATMRNWGQLRTRDGFGDGIDGLVWSEGDQQSVFHLHGALHMFVGPDGSITKLVWNRPLIDQIGGRIDRDMLPLFVTEGTSAQKLQRIAESPYLRHALSCFGASCDDPDAVLFVFGSALNDAHIANLIAEGHVQRVYASVTDIERARADMAALEARWRERRRVTGHPEVELILFAAAEAAPWG
ncbi:DUF4917 family protein [Brevundimonas sp.]|uniref:DUF4917 family protein n=1 Tax=Brevundimonas sp. TaxID=1871086 RepID=UPI0025C512F9|nr:DUF4917 family protein [Brevundimonas sp.]